MGCTSCCAATPRSLATAAWTAGGTGGSRARIARRGFSPASRREGWSSLTSTGAPSPPRQKTSSRGSWSRTQGPGWTLTRCSTTLGPLRGQQQQPDDPHHPEEVDQHQGPRGLCQQGHGGQQGRRRQQHGEDGAGAGEARRLLLRPLPSQPLKLRLDGQEEEEQGELPEVLLHR